MRYGLSDLLIHVEDNFGQSKLKCKSFPSGCLGQSLALSTFFVVNWIALSSPCYL